MYGTPVLRLDEGRARNVMHVTVYRGIRKLYKLTSQKKIVEVFERGSPQKHKKKIQTTSSTPFPYIHVLDPILASIL